MNREDKKIQEERLEDSAADRREAKRIWLVAGTGAAVVLLIAAAAVLWGVLRPEEETPAQASVWEGTMTEVSAMDVMCEPSGIAAMADGSLLVTDTYGKLVWRVQNGISTVYAGGTTVEDPYGEPVGGYNDADPEGSYFKNPWAIAPFLDGYAVTDTDNNAVRLIQKDSIQTINGSTQEDLMMTDMGVAYDHPTGLASDEEGNLYIADTLQNAVRKITPEGLVTTFADNLSDPMGLCWKNRALYAAETGANRIVKIEEGTVSVVAGCGTDGMENGAADQASFSMPQGVAVGDDGTVYVADTGNSAIRRIRDGEVTTLVERDVEDLGAFAPVSPVGLLVQGKQLYICDNFSRKVFSVSLE